MAQEIADSKLLDTWGSGGTKIEPDISKIIEGWQLGEQPPHEYMNWLQNTFGSKLNHILKNGIAEWNNEAEYLAGASVQHSGSIWLCETTNTNSEPTELNANWEKVAINKDLTVTVDTLADLRSISYPANTVWASGYDTKNDGAFGSHIFRLKGVKTTETDNGGTVIIATIGGVDYVYELQYDGAVNVKWFGANATISDNLSSIKFAFNTFNSCILPDEILKVSNGLKIKPLSTIKSNRAISTSYIGDTYNAYAGIKKTTNNKTTITNFETGVSSNVDCIAYIDPYWINGGSFYPQGTSLKNISFSGNTTKNSAGLYIEQGGNFNFENLSFSNTVNSVQFKEVWMTSLKKITGDGIFVHRGGTSTTLDNCWFKNGYSINALIYSSFNNCASDGASDIAYTFTNSKVVLNGCGCEGASTLQAGRGTAIAFNGGNNIEVNNFVCVPKNNQTMPIYSFGHNDYVVFNGGSSHYASNVTGADAHIWFAGATIIFNDYTFANGTKDNPVVTFTPDAQSGSKVIVNYGKNTKIYYCDSSGNTLVVSGEYKILGSARVVGVVYTNTTGAPLNVSISLGLTSTTLPTNIKVNGSIVQFLFNPAGQGIFNCTFVVPNNGTYIVSEGAPVINRWVESI